MSCGGYHSSSSSKCEKRGRPGQAKPSQGGDTMGYFGGREGGEGGTAGSRAYVSEGREEGGRGAEERLALIIMGYIHTTVVYAPGLAWRGYVNLAVVAVASNVGEAERAEPTVWSVSSRLVWPQSRPTAPPLLLRQSPFPALLFFINSPALPLPRLRHPSPTYCHLHSLVPH